MPGVSAKVPGITNIQTAGFPVFYLQCLYLAQVAEDVPRKSFQVVVIKRSGGKIIQRFKEKFNLTEAQVWFGLGICLVVDRRCCSY